MREARIRAVRPFSSFRSELLLGTLGLGTLAGTSLTTTTNSEGIAAAPFTAGRRAATISISAAIVGTRAAWTGQITVTSKNGTRNAAWAIAVVAGAAAAAGIAYAVTRDKDSVGLQPPEVKNP